MRLRHMLGFGLAAMLAGSTCTLPAFGQAATQAPTAEAPKKTRAERIRETWNRVYEEEGGPVNKAPSDLLVAAVQGRTPGTALDLGMGEGRNALFLAERGWQVTGVDLADKALAQAQARAKARGLHIRTEAADLDVFDFGESQWDVIASFYIHAWHTGSKTDVPARLSAALKPGGLLVVEGFARGVGAHGLDPDELRKQFAHLTVVRVEHVTTTKSDWNPNEAPVVRLVAEKPR